MPLDKREEFLAKLQKGNRIQIPVLIRWKHKLKANEILDVSVEEYDGDLPEERFNAKLGSHGRFVIPKIIVAQLELNPKDVLVITLYSTIV